MQTNKRQSIFIEPKVRQRKRDLWWRPEWSAVRRIEKTDHPTAQDVFQATWVLRPTEVKQLLRSKPNHCKRQWPSYVRAMAGLPSLAQGGRRLAAFPDLRAQSRVSSETKLYEEESV
jgi:hypothetical protein